MKKTTMLFLLLVVVAINQLLAVPASANDYVLQVDGSVAVFNLYEKNRKVIFSKLQRLFLVLKGVSADLVQPVKCWLLPALSG